MFRTLLGLAVAAGIIVGGVALFRHRHRLFRPDVNRTGGTLLVFAAEGSPPPEALETAAEVLSRRLDPSGGLGVVVRAGGDDTVEIAVPAGERYDYLGERARELVLQQGRLELRVLANSVDDEEAWKAAQKTKVKGEGLPPPPLNSAGTPEFDSTFPGRPRHRYLWARVNEATLDSLGLGAGAPGMAGVIDPGAAAQIKHSLTTGTPFVPAQGVLAVATRNPDPARPAVIWLLTRQEPEASRIGSEHVSQTRLAERQVGVPSRGPASSTAIMVQFGREGSERLFQLTSQNTTDPSRVGIQRLLGILLDEEVVSAPVIFSASRHSVWITGNHDTEGAERVASVIRGGVLPVKFKPKPVREEIIHPRR